MDNLENMDDDAFEAAFYSDSRVLEGSTEPHEPEDEVEELEEDEIEEADIDGQGNDEEDGLATDEDEDEDEPEEKPKGKRRQSLQERINEVVAKQRTTERERDAAIRELAEIRAAAKPEEKVEPSLREQLPDGAPNPDAKDADGNPIYELGEFDPKFIRDLTKYTITEETKAAKAVEAREAEAKAIQEVQEQIKAVWTDNLDKYESENPDVRQNIENLVEVFDGIETNYGEYLATTIMSSPAGPAIMDYFSQNIGEAQQIVAAGPAAATLAIGALQARLTPSKEEKRNKKVSEANEPPKNHNRGSAGKFAVRPDTDDQDAFEREFFK